jgi:hypothetical protein
MSKAEERALDEYPVLFSERHGYNNTFKDRRESYIRGYHQAEKDLELTWEDMRELYIIFAEVDTEIELCKTDITAETIGYYQEILKRFKEKKGEMTPHIGYELLT